MVKNHTNAWLTETSVLFNLVWAIMTKAIYTCKSTRFVLCSSEVRVTCMNRKRKLTRIAHLRSCDYHLAYQDGTSKTNGPPWISLIKCGRWWMTVLIGLANATVAVAPRSTIHSISRRTTRVSRWTLTRGLWKCSVSTWKAHTHVCNINSRAELFWSTLSWSISNSSWFHRVPPLQISVLVRQLRLCS